MYDVRVNKGKAKFFFLSSASRDIWSQTSGSSAVDGFQTRLSSDEKYTHRSKG